MHRHRHGHSPRTYHAHVAAILPGELASKSSQSLNAVSARDDGKRWHGRLVSISTGSHRRLGEVLGPVHPRPARRWLAGDGLAARLAPASRLWHTCLGARQAGKRGTPRSLHACLRLQDSGTARRALECSCTHSLRGTREASPSIRRGLLPSDLERVGQEHMFSRNAL